MTFGILAILAARGLTEDARFSGATVVPHSERAWRACCYPAVPGQIDWNGAADLSTAARVWHNFRGNAGRG